MDITPLLKLMVEKNASDLFFSTGTVPHLNIEGETLPVGKTPLPPGKVKDIAYGVMNRKQIDEFEETMECNFAIALPGVGRFRANVFRQRGEVGMVLRQIKSVIPSLESLRLPMILKDLIMEKTGLVLVVGPTGSGKSTTLASMIDYRNQNKSGHILTIEDPIEFVHDHKKCVIDQREVGVDTLTYGHALKNAMREAPNIILIGEIRDMETMQYAMSYAETGHLVLSTLHANNAKQTLERIINFFPLQVHSQLLHDLSLQMRAVVAQRLVTGLDEMRVPAVEVMLGAPDIADRIQKAEVDQIPYTIAENTIIGMQTFDQALYSLWEKNLITREEALKNADSRNDLALKMRMGGESGGVEEEPDESGRYRFRL
ncbi:MAG: PilT/PilU family type 4a pilus ATPase [Gammaproteobacteria bacterium]|nr:PilT/PilU family type 4a pilus ATPase [Gammaproteobacteria bacterium]